MKTLYALAVAAAATLGFAASSQAATVTYTNPQPTPKIQLTVSDDPVNALQFSLSTLVGAADYLALGFNYAGSLTQSDLSLVSYTGGANTPALSLFGSTSVGKVNNCGTGCNFNGAGSATLFDYIVRIGQPGAGPNLVSSVVFNIATLAGLSDLTQFAVRATSTSNPGGSIKADLLPQPAPVPLPASGVLLLAGLAGLAVARRRKSASA
ncbi:VPLPA-CTERM sorting domain-containing protein [Paracoccus sp. MC1854]|uniref:VPLPA-CTERM sorting domain-containing protein n=1 Tax=Paracoccus sp. MC1854 TaxID=2760306 RepID=UPI0016015510|nr:VPLPA-CTERM sorting domain-containing protein [Paracoccus sp. MC1854]MBB1492636.1 VPLPA-CTERM sorting domain-containing protein [Paracoccus sp. MC1854]